VKLIVGRPWRLSVGTKSSIEESPRPRRSNSARNLQRLSLRSAFLDSAEAANSLSFSFLFLMVIVFNLELRSANGPVRLLCVSFCFLALSHPTRIELEWAKRATSLSRCSTTWEDSLNQPRTGEFVHHCVARQRRMLIWSRWQSHHADGSMAR
jgi:hypothetical protein